MSWVPNEIVISQLLREVMVLLPPSFENDPCLVRDFFHIIQRFLYGGKDSLKVLPLAAEAKMGIPQDFERKWRFHNLDFTLSLEIFGEGNWSGCIAARGQKKRTPTKLAVTR